MTCYVKKRYVPEKCPKCGAARFRPAKKQGSIMLQDLSELVKGYWNGFHSVERFHPFWRMTLWYGECNKCAMREQLLDTLRYEGFRSRE